MNLRDDSNINFTLGHTQRSEDYVTIKYAGIALAVGVVLSFVSSLFFPGNVIINPVDRTDFPEAVQAIADATVLAHIVTFLSIVGMLLTAFGAFSLLPLATRLGGLAGSLLKFGVILAIIEWSVIVIGMGMQHFVIHVMQRAEDAGSGTDEYTYFEETALATHTMMTALLLTFITIFPFASTLMGIGVNRLVQSMNAYKIGAYALIVCGVGGLIVYLMAMLAAGDLTTYWMMFNILIFIGAVGLFLTGLGMARGAEGLTEDEA